MHAGTNYQSNNYSKLKEMKKMYSKVMLALALASVGTVTPAFAADVVQTNKVWLSGATHI